MAKINDITSAIFKFEEAATKYAQATEQGDYKTANKNYAIIVEAIKFLKMHNEIQKLFGLLNHTSVGVRMWAATYILPVSESEGLRVLKQIAEMTGIHSLDASTTISEWKKGNLKL